MIQSLYEYPLPNNGERYDLSQEELLDLLQKAYDSGWHYGYGAAQVKYDKEMTTYASTNNKTNDWVSDWR